MKLYKIIGAIFWSMFIYMGTMAQQLEKFPAKYDPQTIGLKVTSKFINSPYLLYGSTIAYSEVCTWYGALSFAGITKNAEIKTQLVARFEPFFKDKKRMVPIHDNVDHSVFGALPLALYLHTGVKDYLPFGKLYADNQWQVPEGVKLADSIKGYVKQGLSWQTRLWIDDMYMITLLQVQAFRATGNKEYINRAANEMVFYLKQLQKPNGLFYHAPDVPFYWGRGNGWMAAGMTELLKSLPKDNPDRAFILTKYKLMMRSLLKYQSSDGMWRQLIDDPASWAESSCTGMFTYAMISGVKHGWLDGKRYNVAARKGWFSLVDHLDEVNNITGVCEGTNKKSDRQYYLDRKQITGDFHGQAPVLWCAFALLEK